MCTEKDLNRRELERAMMFRHINELRRADPVTALLIIATYTCGAGFAVAAVLAVVSWLRTLP